MSERRPNLLFLFSDQHAQRVCGCYGDALGPTPHLDALAARGVTFENAYCPSPICVPSRMSMLTARHPSAQACWTNDDHLASDAPTMAHSLGAAGYAPVLVGRMHSVGPDQLRGYTRRTVGDHSPNWPGAARRDMGALQNTHDPHGVSVVRSGYGQSAYEVKDEATLASALGELAALGERRRRGEDAPFALTVSFMLPHAPFVARKEDWDRFAGRVGPPRLAAPADEHPWLAWWRQDRGLGTVDGDAIRRARIAYYALVFSLDRMIGAVLTALEEAGLGDDTLVVYTSDHGEQIGERGLFWKHTFYDDSAKVPLVMAWPGRLPEGARRAQVVNLTDLTCTMLDALQAPPLPHAQGSSFLAVARDAATPWEDVTFSEYCTDAVPDWTGKMAVQQRMIRSGRYKLVHYEGYPAQLFDLADDPDELHDLAASPRHAALRAQLQRRLLADWDPEAIARTMRARRADKDLMAAWTRATGPADAYRWVIEPEMNRLDGPVRFE